VALYTGLPYTPEEDTLLPSPAISVLKERMSEAELEEVKAKTASISGPAAAAAPDGTAATAEQGNTHTESEAGQVKGKTTFGELQSWGLGKEEIEKTLGLPVGKAGVTVRDYCIENGIEFSSVKGALQAAVDRLLGKQ